SGGATLTTDTLQWDRREQLVSTKDAVNIRRHNLEVKASGAQGKPDLGHVSLEKDVQLDIHPPPEPSASGIKVKKKTTITCDGPLEIDYQRNVATFNNNVKVMRPDSTIYSDMMYVYFLVDETAESEDAAAPDDSAGDFGGLQSSKIDRIVARGNVRVVRGENISYSEEAVYTAADRKITLKGRPKLVIVSTEELDAPSGD
ncbi:MAG: LPS export ABC transporter periplasmic protein LptC, partial [Candidatus Omnitrophica bacterium]|nr:LPS export ABC transporter periplasmic protein LptC [Candidatus Omnitrophota bacterium]